MNKFQNKVLRSIQWVVFCMLTLFFAINGYAQCKTYRLSDRGDTLNCMDFKGKKQGKWLVIVPELRGNPGHEEEGEYKDSYKDGVWRNYTPQGDVISVENYRWGLLNGKSLYYNLQGLERQESWWAIDPTKLYDTIEVPDLYEDAVYHTAIVKNEGRSMRHGIWKWYDPTTGYELRSEEFIRDSSINPLAIFGVSKGNKKERTDSAGTAKKKEKPSIVQEWEKKNSGKKKVDVRDGSTGY